MLALFPSKVISTFDPIAIDAYAIMDRNVFRFLQSRFFFERSWIPVPWASIKKALEWGRCGQTLILFFIKAVMSQSR